MTRRDEIGWLLLVTLCLTVPLAAKSGDPAQSAPITGAQRLVLLAYPELQSARIDWRVRVNGTEVVLEAREAGSSLTTDTLAVLTMEAGVVGMAAPAARELPTPPRLRATITLDDRGDVVVTANSAGIAHGPTAGVAGVSGSVTYAACAKLP